MPTYVYGCDNCGHRFEIAQKFQDAPLTECPECGARIRRILQPAGIVFKGSGWYSKDSRAGTQAAKSEDGESAASNGTDRTSKSTDAASPSTTSDTAKSTKSTESTTSKAAD